MLSFPLSKYLTKTGGWGTEIVMSNASKWYPWKIFNIHYKTIANKPINFNEIGKCKKQIAFFKEDLKTGIQELKEGMKEKNKDVDLSA